MTTGRINQITTLPACGEGTRAPKRGPTHPCLRRHEPTWESRMAERQCSPTHIHVHDMYIYGFWKGRPKTPGQPRRRVGVPTPRGDHPIAPTVTLQDQSVRRVTPPGISPSRTPAGCDIWPSGGGSRPHGHADERRLPQGGSPQESGCSRMASGQRSTDSGSAEGPLGPRASITPPGHGSLRPRGGG